MAISHHVWGVFGCHYYLYTWQADDSTSADVKQKQESKVVYRKGDTTVTLVIPNLPVHKMPNHAFKNSLSHILLITGIFSSIKYFQGSSLSFIRSQDLSLLKSLSVALPSLVLIVFNSNSTLYCRCEWPFCWCWPTILNKGVDNIFTVNHFSK